MEERCEVPSEVVATPIALGLTELAPLSVLDGIAGCPCNSTFYIL